MFGVANGSRNTPLTFSLRWLQARASCGLPLNWRPRLFSGHMNAPREPRSPNDYVKLKPYAWTSGPEDHWNPNFGR